MAFIKRQNNKGYLFILPFFLIFVCFQIFPIIYGIFISLTKYDGYTNPVFIGIANYANIMKDSAFWEAFLNTWKMWLPNIIMQVSLALLLSFWFSNISIKIKGVSWFRAIFYFPNLVTAASIALLFSVLLDWQYGTVNQLIFGGDKSKYIDWMGEPVRAQFIIALIQTWLWFGYTMILFMAGLTSISRSYFEAAMIDGASDFMIFRKISLPLLKPVFVYVIVTSFIGGMQLFDIPFVISKLRGVGEPQGALYTSTIYLYQTAFKFSRYGYAAAISYTLFFIIGLVSLLYFRVVREKDKP